MKKLTLVLSAALIALSGLDANAREESSFGGWLFTEISHDFKNGMYVCQYFEHANLSFNRLDVVYGRTTLGCKVLPWLKLAASYVPSYEPGMWKHFMEVEVVGTLKSGNFTVSLRERYRHGFTGGHSNELRSRLKVAYSIPGSKAGVYLAPEVFTWDGWKKTRHFVAFTYDFLDYMQLETYYMYYTFQSMRAEHVIGLGLNFKF